MHLPDPEPPKSREHDATQREPPHTTFFLDIPSVPRKILHLVQVYYSITKKGDKNERPARIQGAIENVSASTIWGIYTLHIPVYSRTPFVV